MRKKRLAFFRMESALRSDNQRSRACRRFSQSAQWIGNSGIFVAKNNDALGQNSSKPIRKRRRFFDHRQRKDAALLGGFDRIGTHALAIHARHLRVLRDDGRQPANTHLDRFLHDEIEPRLFHRREGVIERTCFRLPARLCEDIELYRSLRWQCETRFPLAVAAVEDEKLRARLQAKHMAKIVNGRIARRNSGTRRQIRRNIEPWCSKIVACHKVNVPGPVTAPILPQIVLSGYVYSAFRSFSMRPRLLSAAAGLSILAFAASHAAAQGFGTFGGGGIDCQGQVNGLMAERDKAGKALQAANKRKADIKTACGLLRNYVSIESKMLKFLRGAKVQCGVPDNFIKQLADSHAKSAQMSTKVCQAAANGGGGVRPPSAGLSEALGVNIGGNPGDKPSAVFDTLHGNVLGQ